MTDPSFVDEWLQAERDYHRRLLWQLKKEIREARSSDRPIVRQARG